MRPLFSLILSLIAAVILLACGSASHATFYATLSSERQQLVDLYCGINYPDDLCDAAMRDAIAVTLAMEDTCVEENPDLTAGGFSVPRSPALMQCINRTFQEVRVQNAAAYVAISAAYKELALRASDYGDHYDVWALNRFLALAGQEAFADTLAAITRLDTAKKTFLLAMCHEKCSDAAQWHTALTELIEEEPD